MTAKVENACMGKHTESISVDSTQRACINCIWYEQYFRKGRGSVKTWVPTSIGYCLLNDTGRGALRRPCRNYEVENRTKQQVQTVAHSI